ncbi:MAG: tetratricopeptide repeat protein [Gemmataceae bacterium]|nr:tetratricopeptide repeat protein [Gemmataceae bacterium]
MNRSKRLWASLVVSVLSAAVSGQEAFEDKPKILPPFPPSALGKDSLDGYIRGLQASKRSGIIESLKQLEIALIADPDSLAVKQALVPIYLTLERRDDARKLGLEVLAKKPAEFELALITGRICRQMKRHEEAAQVLEMARKQSALRELPALRVQILIELAAASESTQSWAKGRSALAEVTTLLDEPGSLTDGPYTPEQIVLQSAEVHERLGKMAMKLKQPGPAMDEFLKSGKLDPGRMSRLALHLAEIMEEKGKPQEALVRVGEFLADNPPSIEGYELKVKLLETLGRGGEVLPFLKGAVAASRFNGPLALLYARNLVAAKDTKLAEDILLKELLRNQGPAAAKELLKIWGNQEDLGYGKLLDLLEQGFLGTNFSRDTATLDAALKPADPILTRALTSALQADSKAIREVNALARERLGTASAPSSAVRFYLLMLAAKRIDYPVVEALCESLCVKGPLPEATGAQVVGLWIIALFGQNKDAKAVEVAKKMIPGIEPGLRPKVRLVAARAMGRSGDVTGALGEVKKALAEAGVGERFVCQVGRIEVLFEADRMEQVVSEGKSLLETLTLPGDRKIIKKQMAEALIQLGKNDEVKAIYQELLREDPNDPSLANSMGYFLVDLGIDLSEGERLIRKALELDRTARGEDTPENASFVDSLGWVHFRQGRKEEAAKALRRAIDLPGGEYSAEIWHHLGDVESALGRGDEARRCWQKALKLYDKGVKPERKSRPEEVLRKLTQAAGDSDS